VSRKQKVGKVGRWQEFVAVDFENKMEKAIKIIKEEIENRGLKVLKIILFGSRAKGDFKEDSDWDFFVVIDKKLNFNEKWDIIDEIKIKLARLKFPNDIIIKSEDEVMENKDDVGRITYYVLKEGIKV
jgi:predicted nucleotidyltransferase